MKSLIQDGRLTSEGEMYQIQTSQLLEDTVYITSDSPEDNQFPSVKRIKHHQLKEKDIAEALRQLKKSGSLWWKKASTEGVKKIAMDCW